MFVRACVRARAHECVCVCVCVYVCFLFSFFLLLPPPPFLFFFIFSSSDNYYCTAFHNWVVLLFDQVITAVEMTKTCHIPMTLVTSGFGVSMKPSTSAIVEEQASVTI